MTSTKVPGFFRMRDCAKAFAGCILNNQEGSAVANWLADSRPKSKTGCCVQVHITEIIFLGSGIIQSPMDSCVLSESFTSDLRNMFLAHLQKEE